MKRVEIRADMLTAEHGKEVLLKLKKNNVFLPIQLQCSQIPRGRTDVNKQLMALYKPESNDEDFCLQNYNTCDLLNM